jgi:hypothetical protein
MRCRVSALVAGWLVLGLAGSSSAQQPAASGLLGSTELVGTWKLDRDKTKDNQDVWKRKLDALRAAQDDPDGGGPFNLRVSHAPFSGDWQLKSAMRDLLEVAESLSFRVASDSVTITDDLRRALTFATTGNKEKRQLAATEFNVRTKFTGNALTQQMTVDELVMTEIYLPSEDGREMLVSISVEKPDFQPPLKTIMRVYTRTDVGSTPHRP